MEFNQKKLPPKRWQSLSKDDQLDTVKLQQRISKLNHATSTQQG
jgi:hypothetical protein